jgi:hypothetical protein
MSSVRNWAASSVIVALILLSPIVAFLVVIAAEMLIGFGMEVEVPIVCAVAAAIAGWVLSRRMSSNPEPAHRSEPELETDETATAAQPM